jgi:hypothetical protein
MVLAQGLLFTLLLFTLLLFTLLLFTLLLFTLLVLALLLLTRLSDICCEITDVVRVRLWRVGDLQCRAKSWF